MTDTPMTDAGVDKRRYATDDHYRRVTEHLRAEERLSYRKPPSKPYRLFCWLVGPIGRLIDKLII